MAELRRGIRVTVETEVEADEAERFYTLYQAAFGRLRLLGAARQVLHRDEFFQEMRDPRVSKYIAWSAEDRPIGLTALSADLATVPWISPEFFAARFPEHAARNAIYYVHFMLAHPDERRSGSFDAMFQAVTDLFLAERAVSLYDICAYNIVSHNFAANLRSRLEAAASVIVEALDSQTYYSAVFEGPRDSVGRTGTWPGATEKPRKGVHGFRSVGG